MAMSGFPLFHRWHTSMVQAIHGMLKLKLSCSVAGNSRWFRVVPGLRSHRYCIVPVGYNVLEELDGPYPMLSAFSDAHFLEHVCTFLGLACSFAFHGYTLCTIFVEDDRNEHEYLLARMTVWD